MSTGIQIVNCEDVSFVGLNVSGFEKAFEFLDSSNVEFQDSSFTGKVVVERVKGFTATRNLQYNTAAELRFNSRPMVFKKSTASGVALIAARFRVPMVWRRYELAARTYQQLYGLLNGNV